MPGPWDCIFQPLPEPEACPEGGIEKVPIMFFQRAIMLAKMPKIYVYSLKTLDTRAS